VRIGTTAAAGIVLLTLSIPAAAQPRVEGFGSLSTPVGGPNGLFITDYIPELVYGGGTGGRAGQTLNLDSGREFGFEGGVNVLFVPRAGLQVFVSRDHRTFDGPNTPYDLRLEYLARQPPDYIQRAYTFDRSFDWPDTVGDMTTWHVAANGLLRFEGRRADVTLTGGLLLSHPTGQFETAAFHEFRLGGHSVLFYEEAIVGMKFEESWHAGFNAGAEVAVRIGRHVALTAGIRLLTSPEPIVDVAEIVDDYQILFDMTIEDIQAELGGNPADFDRFTPVFRFGVRIH
jgi:hypothetical protein